MGEKRHRASSVDKLPEPIRHTVGRLIASNFTLDQIVDKLKELEATAEIDFEAPSRSALGRYAERLRAAQERIGRSRAIAEALAPTFGENPDNQVGRLAAEVLQTVIFDIMTAVEVDEETGESKPVLLGAKEAQSLAKSLQSLASAQKIDADRIVKVRQEMAKEAAKAVDKVANQQGLGKDMRAALMEAALGIAT